MTLLPTLVLQVLTTGAAATAVAGNAPHCESSRPEFGDSMEVQCALRESETPRKFRFQITFTGGHDDTKASLTATLNGKPLACDEGSKPKLMGEDGEVSINCYFSSERIKGAQALKVSVEWHHAQYSEHQLDVL